MYRLRKIAKQCRLMIAVFVLLTAAATAQMSHAAERSAPSRTTSEAANHLISNIILDPPTPNVLGFNQNVNITFDYTTDEVGGVRIFARPFSGGALTPNYAAHGSPLHPAGSGGGTGFFTITSGDVTVDQIRFQMWNADQSVLLFEAFIPVYYRFTDTTNLVSNITLDPPTPNILGFNQNVNITFDYTTDEAGGVRIFARPFSGGALTPNYAAHGSPLHPVGSGSGTGFFTITSGDITVDHIRFQMWNADQSVLLFEAFIPVYYRFTDTTNLVSNITLNPPTPNILGFNQNVNITFDYTTDEAGGVRIFARPFSSGSLTPNYAAHGSPIHPVGSGSGTGFFTITSGDVTVDQIRFQMWNADQSELLFEAFIPVCYQFGKSACLDKKVYLPIVMKQ